MTIVTLEELYRTAAENPDNAEAQQAVVNAEKHLAEVLDRHRLDTAESEEDKLMWSRKLDIKYIPSGEIYEYTWNGRSTPHIYLSEDGKDELMKLCITEEEQEWYTIDNLGNETIKAGLADKVILCCESAAEWLGLPNIVSTNNIVVYSKLEQEQLPEFIKKIDADYTGKDIIECDGLYCTSEVQTILDMLEPDYPVDSWCLTESLANLYIRNREIFDEVLTKLNSRQKQTLELYYDDAVHYYDY